MTLPISPLPAATTNDTDTDTSTPFRAAATTHTSRKGDTAIELDTLLRPIASSSSTARHSAELTLVNSSPAALDAAAGSDPPPPADEMKFSHSIQFNAVPDWSSHYIAYSNLKKLYVALPLCSSLCLYYY